MIHGGSPVYTIHGEREHRRDRRIMQVSCCIVRMDRQHIRSVAVSSVSPVGSAVSFVISRRYCCIVCIYLRSIVLYASLKPLDLPQQLELTIMTHQGPWQQARHFTTALTGGATDVSSNVCGGVVNTTTGPFLAGRGLPSEWLARQE